MTDLPGLPARSATELAAAIAAKNLSPLEAMEAYLARVDAIDPQLNAFALRDDERVLADARAATERISRSTDDLGPLFGVPVPIKDLDDVEGWPTTLGSWASSDEPRPADGRIAERMRRAGAVLMGKTTTPEFGTVSYTESDRLGITRNPWNTDHTPGGSSGGAAAAVSVGMAPIAHASDGGGSIRIPASCCGLVGLKPGRHRITEDYELMGGGATGGVVSRTVADTALALDVLAVRDPLGWNMAPPPERPFRDEVGRDPGRLRVAVCLESPLGVPVDPEPRRVAERAVELLAGAGHEILDVAVRWPDPATVLTAFMTIWSTGSALYDLPHPERVEPHDRPVEPRPTADAYARSLRDLQLATRLLAGQLIEDFDLLVTPTMAVEPPKVGTWLEGVDLEHNPGQAILNCLPMATFTAIFNMTGLPAISLPVDLAASGLPVGAQLVAGPWQEARLLRVAAQLEDAVRWHERWPAMAGI
jgi:amidase